MAKRDKLKVDGTGHIGHAESVKGPLFVESNEELDPADLDPEPGSIRTYCPPLIFGFALEHRDGGYLACRISTHGAVEYLGPKMTSGEPRIESKHLALSRAHDALKAAYAPPSKMRYG